MKKNNLYYEIINEIYNNTKVTELMLANKYNCSERTIRRYIRKLKNEGIIKRYNSGKNRKWIIIN